MSNIIVLAEDEPVLGQVAQTALEKAGYIVFWRTNGLDAWESIETSHPDLVILDHNMPGLTGGEVLAKTKASPQTRGIPVLMASANADRMSIVASLKAGAADYLVRPFPMPVLVERVNRILAAQGGQLARLA